MSLIASLFARWTRAALVAGCAVFVVSIRPICLSAKLSHISPGWREPAAGFCPGVEDLRNCPRVVMAYASP